MNLLGKEGVGGNGLCLVNHGVLYIAYIERLLDEKALCDRFSQYSVCVL